MNINYFNYLYHEIMSNVSLYILILIAISIVYIVCLRKHIYSVIDPINLMILACVFSTSNVIFMYVKNMISAYYFWHYCITETVMLIGIIIISPINFNGLKKEHKTDNAHLTSESKIDNLSYIITSLLFNICTLIVYSKVGFILFNKTDSRLGLGIQAGYSYTIINIINIFYSYLLVMRFFKKTNILFRIYDIFNFAILVLYFVMSGSKSSFITFVIAIFYYIMYLKKNNKIFEKRIKRINVIACILLIVCAINAIIIANITTGNTGKFDAIMYRLLAYGDIYPMYYIPNIRYSGGNFFNGMILMFYPFIGVIQKVVGIFNIHIVQQFPTVIGLQVYQALFNTDIIQGPNSRHNIFGLFYFGYVGSIVFSFTLGIFIGFCRNKLYKYIPNNTFGIIIYTIFSLDAVTNITDPSLGMVDLIQSLIYYLLIYAICYIIINPRSLKLIKGKV